MARKTSNNRTNKIRKDYDDEMFNEMKSDVNKKFTETTYTINSKFKNVKQKEFFNVIINKNVRIIFVKGSAGSGKTFCGLMAALHCLKNKEFNINKIILSKIIVPAAKDIGFLKGTLEEKTAVYFESYWSNIVKLIGGAATTMLKDRGIIEESLVNFMRGVTFGSHDPSGRPIGMIAILDEAQNSTIGEMRTFISRLGENTKLIIMGDSDQMDIKLARGEKHGLDDAFERFKDMDGVKFVEFTEDDIVRDKFLIEIMKRYKTN